MPWRRQTPNGPGYGWQASQTRCITSTSAHAFLYRNGALTDLNTLLPDHKWELQYANAINNKGQIVGTGWHNGRQRAFLLSLN